MDVALNKGQATFSKTEPPQWLLDMWQEIDDKTFGKGFDCFTEDAVCNLGVADWKGREAIRKNLKAFIDTGFTAQHHVTEYWDAGFLKFRGIVDMKPDDRSKPVVHPTMSHFFYMDEKTRPKCAGGRRGRTGIVWLVGAHLVGASAHLVTTGQPGPAQVAGPAVNLTRWTMRSRRR